MARTVPTMDIFHVYVFSILLLCIVMPTERVGGPSVSSRIKCLTLWIWGEWCFSLVKVYPDVQGIWSKQARRAGMAGPLGELIDHGMHRGLASTSSGWFDWLGCAALSMVLLCVLSSNLRPFQLEAILASRVLVLWTESWSSMVDCCIASCHSCHLSSNSDVGRQPYSDLGPFSGPVKGRISHDYTHLPNFWVLRCGSYISWAFVRTPDWQVPSTIYWHYISPTLALTKHSPLVLNNLAGSRSIDHLWCYNLKFLFSCCHCHW